MQIQTALSRSPQNADIRPASPPLPPPPGSVGTTASMINPIRTDLPRSLSFVVCCVEETAVRLVYCNSALPVSLSLSALEADALTIRPTKRQVEKNNPRRRNTLCCKQFRSPRPPPPPLISHAPYNIHVDTPTPRRFLKLNSDSDTHCSLRDLDMVQDLWFAHQLTFRLIRLLLVIWLTYRSVNGMTG